MGKRAALYLRVSTTRQAEKDLSIPDQRSQALAHCEAKGWTVVGEYTEAGASATDDKRPEFQRMIDDAKRPERPFDVILVHSFSRFFRDMVLFGVYSRDLEKHDVRVVSITQETSEDAQGELMRHLLATFDWYQSQETAKHVRRAMMENARQGFWNGSRPPFGYRTVAVETRGDAIKKKLDIDPVEAETVHEVFSLCLDGKGIRAIADHLNRKGLTYRRGRKFTSGLVHQILTRTAYVGRHHYNRTDSKTGKTKARSEWVEFATPVVIEPETFERVQRLLESRRPTRTPPRVVNGPTLLTGLAKCGTCGGGMTLRTGKGGRYRYYSCNNRVNEGATTCAGRNVRMETLDALVVDQLECRVFAPDRLEKLLGRLLVGRQNRTQEHAARAKQLRKQQRDTEQKIERLYTALAEGTVQDTALFRNTLSKYERDRDELTRLASSLDRQQDLPRNLLTPKNLARFSRAIRERLHDSDGAFRKSYVRQFVDRIEVDDEEVRIYGPKSALVQGLASSPESARTPVPSFDPKWWARQEPNVRCQKRRKTAVLTPGGGAHCSRSV